MKSNSKRSGVIGYIPRAWTCSGICSIHCKDYRKRKCPSYTQTFTERKTGRILTQIEAPIDLAYIKKKFWNDKDIVERSNYNFILGKAFTKMEEEGYIKKEDVFKRLENDYNLKFTDRSLRNYVVEKLIEKPEVKGVKGVAGSVSFYNKNTPALVFLIKWLRKVKAKLTFSSIRGMFNLLEMENIEELKRLSECKDFEARLQKLDLLYIGFFRALVELDILKRVNLMSKDEIEKFSFGKLLENPIVENMFMLLDQDRCEISEDHIMIRLNPPVERKVYFRREGIEIVEI